MCVPGADAWKDRYPFGICSCRLPIMFVDVNAVPSDIIKGAGVKVRASGLRRFKEFRRPSAAPLEGILCAGLPAWRSKQRESGCLQIAPPAIGAMLQACPWEMTAQEIGVRVWNRQCALTLWCCGRAAEDADHPAVQPGKADYGTRGRRGRHRCTRKGLSHSRPRPDYACFRFM